MKNITLNVRSGHVFVSVLFVAALFLAPFSLHAHVTGKTIEKQIGKYLLDIGYNPDPVTAGDSTYFDFKLYQREPSPGDAAYRDVWVRVYQGKTTLFATGVNHMESGSTGMVYTFPNPGVYSVSVRYETADDTLAETTFDVPVVASDEATHTQLLADAIAATAGFFFGVAVITGWHKRAWFKRK